MHEKPSTIHNFAILQFKSNEKWLYFECFCRKANAFFVAKSYMLEKQA
jgi:hypothetical protein